MKNIDFIKIEEEYSLTRYPRSNRVFQKGQGAWLWDIESEQYFDLTSIYHHAVFGHTPSRLVNVLLEQAKTLSLNTQKILAADRLGPFLKKLTQMSGFERASASSSQYQAYSDMVAYAELYAKSFKMIEEGLPTCLVITDTSSFLFGASGTFPNVSSITIQDAYKLESLSPNIAVVMVDLLDLNQPDLFVTQELIAKLRQLCHRHQALLIADLAKIPFAMFGVTFATEIYPARTFDGIVWGEYLGAGLSPLAAISVNEDIYVRTGPLRTSLSTLYPLGAAVGLEALCMVEELFLTESAVRYGSFLKTVFAKTPSIEHIYTRGSVFKLKFMDQEALKEFLSQCEEEHLLVHPLGDLEVMLAPPLICSDQELDLLLKALKKIFPQEQIFSIEQ